MTHSKKKRTGYAVAAIPAAFCLQMSIGSRKSTIHSVTLWETVPFAPLPALKRHHSNRFHVNVDPDAAGDIGIVFQPFVQRRFSVELDE